MAPRSQAEMRGHVAAEEFVRCHARSWLEASRGGRHVTARNREAGRGLQSRACGWVDAPVQHRVSLLVFLAVGRLDLKVMVKLADFVLAILSGEGSHMHESAKQPDLANRHICCMRSSVYQYQDQYQNQPLPRG